MSIYQAAPRAAYSRTDMPTTRAATSVPDVDACTISAVSYAGLSVMTKDGRPATLAVIDNTGKVLASGPQIEHAAWEVSVRAYRNFLMGTGHLRVLSGPPPAFK